MNKELEKRFREKFLQSAYCGDRECCYEGDDKCFHGTENAILAFLDSELKAERERIKKWADKQYGSILQGGLTDDKNKGYKNALDDLLEELNKS